MKASEQLTPRNRTEQRLPPALRSVAAALVVGVTLAGCGVGSLVGDGSNSANQLADTTATPNEISQVQSSALPAIATECPPIKVRDGGESIFAYANNRIGDARALQFQAVIDGQSRNCVVSNGLITVKMGVVGRLVLGPSSSQNSMTLPLRFAVERDEITVFSQVYNIPMTVTPPSQSEEFVKVVENVAIPYLGGEDIVIWVGFDSQV
ncbi:MAG TPA: hypothetical protein ENJ90_08915 [Devosia sp.]|nr:hypothetical protein [Devosia sp.]